jgi:hypothetical protein
MSLLRLLTNPKVMGEDLLSPEEAINVYRELSPMNECTMLVNRITLRTCGCR